MLQLRPVGSSRRLYLHLLLFTHRNLLQAKSVDFSKVVTSDIYQLIPNAMQGSNAPVGLTCSPLIQDLSGGVQCNQQTVCCDGGHFVSFLRASFRLTFPPLTMPAQSGLISINCIAFNPGSSATSII